MADMKVAYILHQTTSIGGGNKSFMEMLKGLMQKGVQPYIIMPDRNDIFHNIEEMNVPTFVTTFRNNTYPDIQSWKDFLLFLPRTIARLYINRKATNAVVHYLQNKKIDLIHTNVSVCNIGEKAAQKLNVPHIYHIREYGDKDFNYHYFPNRESFIEKLDEPHCYTIFITKDIQQHFGQTGKAASRVIYNGIQPSAKSMPAGDGNNYFLYAGRVTRPKGLYELLCAYNSYCSSTANPLPLYVAGDTDDRNYVSKLKDYIDKHHLTENVRFLGVQKDIARLMRQAKAIIIPSHNEGFGRCMPEAMFNGCLCIGHDTGGTKEQMDNGTEATGEDIALRYQTEDQLTDILKKVSNSNMEFFLPMKERAFLTVNKLYSTENNISNIFGFYGFIIHQENS